jgi:hypothetical protein
MQPGPDWGVSDGTAMTGRQSPMKLFSCQYCAQVLYFENTRCEKCAHPLGYLPDQDVVTALEPDGAAWRALAASGGSHRFCANAAYDACNWLVPADSTDVYCKACRHNRTVPDLSVPANLPPWRRLELAKHRLFYTLLQLHLPLQNRLENPEHGLVFDFLADQPAAAGPKVMTGHDNGVITLALAEADDVERERRRVAMGEPYRTLLGHFRHEVGHHFWDILVRDGGRLAECRAVFGDDSRDYDEALQAYYAHGAPANWQENYVSFYASAHPWEDFAETWAHYLHIIDTLEMASAFGVRVHPKVARTPGIDGDVNVDPAAGATIADMIGEWLPLTFALNSLNRCMGASDLYPFILTPAVIEKLGFIHRLVRAP